MTPAEWLVLPVGRLLVRSMRIGPHWMSTSWGAVQARCPRTVVFVHGPLSNLGSVFGVAVAKDWKGSYTETMSKLLELPGRRSTKDSSR